MEGANWIIHCASSVKRVWPFSWHIAHVFSSEFCQVCRGPIDRHHIHAFAPAVSHGHIYLPKRSKDIHMHTATKQQEKKRTKSSRAPPCGNSIRKKKRKKTSDRSYKLISGHEPKKTSTRVTRAKSEHDFCSFIMAERLQSRSRHNTHCIRSSHTRTHTHTRCTNTSSLSIEKQFLANRLTSSYPILHTFAQQHVEAGVCHLGRATSKACYTHTHTLLLEKSCLTFRSLVSVVHL